MKKRNQGKEGINNKKYWKKRVNMVKIINLNNRDNMSEYAT